MLPILFKGTPFETPTYYVLFLLAALGAFITAIYKAKSFGLKTYRAVDIGFIGFASGVLGGRLFHVLIEAPAYYWEHPVRVFYLWQGGFVLYGGLIMGFLGGLGAAIFFKENLGRWAIVAAPAILVGVGIGRMGCLAGGCCHGTETEWFWGMIFTNPASSAPLHIPLHPTQALEALFCFVVAAAFWFVYRKPEPEDGRPLAWAFLSYAIFRFIIEFLRGDLDRGVYYSGTVSTSQIISLVVGAICVGWILYFRRKASMRG